MPRYHRHTGRDERRERRYHRDHHRRDERSIEGREHRPHHERDQGDGEYASRHSHQPRRDRSPRRSGRSRDSSRTSPCRRDPRRSGVEAVERMLKELYPFLDRVSIQEVVSQCSSEITHFSQGFLMEMASRRLRMMFGAASGFAPVASYSAEPESRSY